MAACAILPRIIVQGHASELLYTGRATRGEECERWGFFNRLIEAEAQAQAICMLTQDFKRACEAFAAKQQPVFQGD
jgi:enoyl-CoA hydratase/carnithine racemase